MGRAVVNVIDVTEIDVIGIDTKIEQVLAINDKNESIVGYLTKDNLQWNCQSRLGTLLNIKKFCLLKEVFI